VYDPAPDGHTNLPSMSTARGNFGMGRLGGLVCAVGGTPDASDTALASCECLDTANPGAGWSTIPSLRTARWLHAVASTGDTMCAIGGDASGAWPPNSLSSVECYRQGAAAWVELVSLNTARTDHGAAAVGDVIFAVGGNVNGDQHTFLSSVEALDLSVDGGRWEEKAPMPTARGDVAVAASGTKLFAVGGWDGRNFLDALEVYESTTDSWSAATPMPTARGGLAVAIVGNTLLALGGYGSLDVVEAYGIEGGSWSAAEPMATPRFGFAAAAGP